MQTEFQFHFSTNGFIFKKDHKFNGTIGDKNKPFLPKYGLDVLEFKIRIVRGDNKNNGNATQKGFLFIRVPLRYEPAQDIIMDLVYFVMQKINFNNAGEFKVAGGFYSGERIPETEEEIREVGDKACFAHMSVIEDVGDPVFDSSQFVSQASEPEMDLVLINQHNHAAQTKHPIDRYLSYYKIIEDVFFGKSQTSAKKLLSKSSLLKEIYDSAFDSPSNEKEYKEFISKIVDIRHECSHLKRGSDFGYIINDKRIESDVEPYLDLMHYITHQLIIKNGSA